MKKHYAFIPIKDQDVKEFRKLLIGDLWFRPIFAILMILVLIYLGITKHVAETASGLTLFLYAFAIALMLYLIFSESSKLHYIWNIKKKNLLPFIRTVKIDASFYTEELSDGFIIQTEPVNLVDITKCNELLSEIVTRFEQSSTLIVYLKNCINSHNESLVNKAVIYSEIIKEQLDLGNLDILDSGESIHNYKGEEMP